MAKAFTKGQEVTFIQNWDSKGTFTYQHAIVYSCGTKQMVLTDAKTGEEMGRHFNPDLGQRYHNEGQTFPRMTDEAAIAICLDLGAKKIEEENVRFNRLLNSGQRESYNASIRKDIAELHEPRAMAISVARVSA